MRSTTRNRQLELYRTRPGNMPARDTQSLMRSSAYTMVAR